MIRDGVITLNGSAQQLHTALGLSERDAEHGVMAVSFQPGEANAGPVYIGADSAIAAATYGWRLAIATAGVPPAPLIIGEFEYSALRLDNFWVLGTNLEKLHVVWIEH